MAADVILHNAKIATDRAPTFVEAVAIESAKFVVAGNSDEILCQRGPARLLDAFFEHCHFVFAG
jgi:predicted amidohydrolase YtcJ